MAVTSRLRRLRQTVVAVAALLTLLVLAGATYQGVATALERREFPRPGGLVDAGGHQLHISCAGQGSPMVILEAAAGSMSAAWAWIQPEIARVTRVCAYDRSGLGWSEAGDGGYVAERVPEELHALLEHAGEPGRVVIVGHELGAAFARSYAARYAATTSALVLVDEPQAGAAVPGPRFASAWPWLARAGILRASGSLTTLAAGLPGEAGAAVGAFLNRPDHLTRAAMELASRAEVARAARTHALDPAIIVAPVSVGIPTSPAMLVAREDASKVTRAIEETVAHVREADARTSPNP